jgi:multisubunit Na+/H+ antiporter MnhB subunit
MIGYGAATQGKAFRVFSGVIVLIFLVFGILTTNESGWMEAGLPTPNIGIWERINIAAYMAWVIVFAIILIRSNEAVKESL